MVKASLITIGDEILIGQIIDTNSSWIGQKLTDRGIDVVRRYSVGDDGIEIQSALDMASANSDIVIITGGLGPTEDDVTKKAILDYFQVDSYFDQENYDWIVELFAKYGRTPLESHRIQCYLPMGCKKIVNKMGTAPGIHMEKEGTHFIFTPGVPLEMKYIMDKGLLPWIEESFKLPRIYYRTVLTAGKGESVVADMIKPAIQDLPDFIKIAYLPGLHQVRVRVLAQDVEDEDFAMKVVDNTIESICEIMGDDVYGLDDISLSKSLGIMLESQGKMLALAESCTGGYVSHLITAEPGSSAYYNGGIVAYSNDMKIHRLGVEKSIIEEHGAVSEQTVIEMAKGAIQHFESDVALAISGVAGPSGGTYNKPVGTVWMCVADKDHHYAKCFHLSKTRILNIKQGGNIGLNMIRKFLLGSELA